MDERLVLTKQDISRDLLRAHKQRYRLATLLWATLSVLLAFYVSFATSSLAGKIAIYSVFSALLALIVYLYVRAMYIYKNCRFSVEKDTVVAVEHDKYHFFTLRHHSSIQEKVTFLENGVVFAHKNQVGACTQGDTFYLVKYKKRVLRLYNARSYSYNEQKELSVR